MAEEKKLNIYQKIQKSRVELCKKSLKKTGENKFSNYKYFELGDFLPQIQEICNLNGITPIFHWDINKPILTLYDSEDPESKLEFGSDVEIASLKGCSSIQNIGGTQTYVRRYLYMMAFEIAETDTIDGGEIDIETEEKNKKIKKPTILTIRKLIAETNTDIKDFLKWAGVAKIEDITNQLLPTIMNKFEATKKNLEKVKKEQEEHQKDLQTQQQDFDF